MIFPCFLCLPTNWLYCVSNFHQCTFSDTEGPASYCWNLIFYFLLFFYYLNWQILDLRRLIINLRKKCRSINLIFIKLYFLKKIKEPFHNFSLNNQKNECNLITSNLTVWMSLRCSCLTHWQKNREKTTPSDKDYSKLL